MPLLKSPTQIKQERASLKEVKETLTNEQKKEKKELAIRSMIVAPKDHILIEFDLSQAETWVTAYLANEPKMKYFLKHSDIHTETAAYIFKESKENITSTQRFLGKKGNHQLSYRSSHYMLARSINAESDNPPYVTVSIPEAKHIYDEWHGLYTQIKGYWYPATEDELNRNRRVMITPYGRSAMFFQEWGEELFKAATAYVPQSTVADHLNGLNQDNVSELGGLRKVRELYVDKKACKIINQSHDSFILEAHKSHQDDLIEPIYNLLYRPLVINGEEFYIPVDCKVGDRWGELEEIEI